jgi:hypothetical protein
MPTTENSSSAISADCLRNAFKSDTARLSG